MARRAGSGRIVQVGVRVLAGRHAGAAARAARAGPPHDAPAARRRARGVRRARLPRRPGSTTSCAPRARRTAPSTSTSRTRKTCCAPSPSTARRRSPTSADQIGPIDRDDDGLRRAAVVPRVVPRRVPPLRRRDPGLDGGPGRRPRGRPARRPGVHRHRERARRADGARAARPQPVDRPRSQSTRADGHARAVQLRGRVAATSGSTTTRCSTRSTHARRTAASSAPPR